MRKNDEIMSSDMQPIGKRKSLIFYIGRPHRASQTEWRMHEYHLIQEECGALASQVLEPMAYVKCLISISSGIDLIQKKKKLTSSLC